MCLEGQKPCLRVPGRSICRAGIRSVVPLAVEKGETPAREVRGNVGV